MNLQNFLMLVGLGVILGFAATLFGKTKKLSLALNLIVATAGVVLGWLLFTQISGAVLQLTFALGGGLALLWLVRLLKK
jgi:uncharacterized membrane protein YfcA